MKRAAGFSATATSNAARARASVRQIASVSIVVALEPFLDVEIEAGQPMVSRHRYFPGVAAAVNARRGVSALRCLHQLAAFLDQASEDPNSEAATPHRQRTAEAGAAIIEASWQLLRRGLFRIPDDGDYDDDPVVQETVTSAERARARRLGAKLFAVRQYLRRAKHLVDAGMSRRQADHARR